MRIFSSVGDEKENQKNENSLEAFSKESLRKISQFIENELFLEIF